MNENTINSFTKQFLSLFSMLEDALEKTDEEIWKKKIDLDFFVPCRLIIHIIETMDYYFDDKPKEFAWNKIGEWETVDDELLPEREAVIEYYKRVKEKIKKWFDEIYGKDINRPEDVFQTDWVTELERAIYVLRHSHHHLGQLSLDLQRRGYDEIIWE
jgi:hypothetical protein